MPTGTVKWFNNAKGFGFILPDQGNEDVFAHYSMIEMDGYRTLKAGQTVEFEISQGEKGLHAVNIRHAISTAEAETSHQAPNAPSSEGSTSDQLTNNCLSQPEIEDA